MRAAPLPRRLFGGVTAANVDAELQALGQRSSQGLGSLGAPPLIDKTSGPQRVAAALLRYEVHIYNPKRGDAYIKYALRLLPRHARLDPRLAAELRVCAWCEAAIENASARSMHVTKRACEECATRLPEIIAAAQAELAEVE